MNEVEAATRLIRDINGGNLELPKAQLRDVRAICLHILQKADVPAGPAFHGALDTSWPSQTEHRFGDQ